MTQREEVFHHGHARLLNKSGKERSKMMKKIKKKPEGIFLENEYDFFFISMD